jgi:hypothetical protein
MPAWRWWSVQHTVALLHDALQPIGYLMAVAAAARQRQMMANAPVRGREIQRRLLPHGPLWLALQRTQP